MSWLLGNCICGQNSICVHKQSSYQPAVLTTRGTEKIKFTVLLKMAVQRVVAWLYWRIPYCCRKSIFNKSSSEYFGPQSAYEKCILTWQSFFKKTSKLPLNIMQGFCNQAFDTGFKETKLLIIRWPESGSETWC